MLKKKCLNTVILPHKAKEIGLNLSADGKKRNLYALIGFDNVDKKRLLEKFSFLRKSQKEVLDQLIIQSKYQTHVQKQKGSVYSYNRDKSIKIPLNIDYKKIGGLSKESCDALENVKPEDLASAAKIPGVTAAALSSVLLYTKKVKKIAG